jgi:hypothetical protein
MKTRGKRKIIWERIVSLEESGRRDWDIAFWQAQSASARFHAAWNMIKDFYKMRGKKINANTLRLQRSVAVFKQI